MVILLVIQAKNVLLNGGLVPGRVRDGAEREVDLRRVEVERALDARRLARRDDPRVALEQATLPLLLKLNLSWLKKNHDFLTHLSVQGVPCPRGLGFVDP